MALRSSVAQDRARSQAESQTTEKKRMLQRAFGALSVLYIVCFIPRIFATAVDYYYEYFLDGKVYYGWYSKGETMIQIIRLRVRFVIS